MAMHPQTIDPELNGWPLLDSPWSVRFGRGTRDRIALEVYNNGLLLDVLVARPLVADVLRGARRGERDGQPSVLAWGHLPVDGAPPAVAFSQKRRPPQPAESIATAGTFWIALAPGTFDRVTATSSLGTTEQLRVRAGWSR